MKRKKTNPPPSQNPKTSLPPAGTPNPSPTFRSDFNFIAVADYHFAHHKIPVDLQYQHTVKYLYPVLKSGKVDILFFPGDFSDHLLTLDSNEVGVWFLLMLEIFAMAKEHQFLVRILEGTNGHDYRQCKNFLVLQDFYQETLFGVPLINFASTISIEEIEAWNLKIGYIPDNQVTENTSQELHQLMRKQNITQLDMLISHGYYLHLLGEGVPTPRNTLDYNEISKLIQGPMINGHVHTSGIKGRMVSCGSFERFTHGEEEPKGFQHIYYHRGNSIEVTFKQIVNYDALPFITVDLLHDSDPEVSLNKIRNRLSSFGDLTKRELPFYLRLVTEDTNKAKALSHTLVEEYPCLVMSCKTFKHENELPADTVLESTLPIVTPDNLDQLTYNFIKRKNPNTKLTLERVGVLLNEHRGKR